jgi:hypothetical protein
MHVVVVDLRTTTQGYNITLIKYAYRMRSQRSQRGTRRGFWTDLQSLEKRELWRGWK